MKLHPRRSLGQAGIEFALVMPLLSLLLLSLVDFGMFLHAQVQVTNAAREGARAGSLYLGGRFHYTACYSNCPTGYGTGGACWYLQDWVENAVVERNRASSGCPASGTNASINSLGILNATKCASATSGTNCWWLQPVTSNYVPITGSDLPVAGNPLEVRLIYRYTPALFGDFAGFDQNPLVIAKTVIMKVQNN